MRSRVSMPTAIVQAAQKRYPQMLNAAVEHIGIDPPYGKEKIDPRTRDNQLVRMLPTDLQALAQTDPKAYMNVQERLQVLQDKASQQEPLPAQGAFEGKV